MNKFYLVVIIFFTLFQSFTQAQNSFPKYEDKPVWCIKESVFGVPKNEYTLELRTDTMICDRLYTKVIGISQSTMQSIILNYIRYEDKKIYETSLSCRERLLYDFSLTVGDTIWHDEYEYGIISKEDTINYNSIQRRALTVDYPQLFPVPMFPIQRTWVEGIGDLFHPFRSSHCIHGNCEFDSKVICLSTNAGVLYGQCTAPCNIENNTTDTDNLLHQSYRLQLSANPVRMHEALQVNYHFPKATAVRWMVTNMLGQVLYQQAFQAGSAEGSISLSWSPSVAGVYWLIWQDHNGNRQSVKFISQ